MENIYNIERITNKILIFRLFSWRKFNVTRIGNWWYLQFMHWYFFFLFFNIIIQDMHFFFFFFFLLWIIKVNIIFNWTFLYFKDLRFHTYIVDNDGIKLINSCLSSSVLEIVLMALMTLLLLISDDCRSGIYL